MKLLATFSLALVLLSACAPPGSMTHPSGLVVTAPRGVVANALEAAARAYTQTGGEAVRVEAVGSQDYAARVDAALMTGLDRFDLVYLPAEELAKWAGYRAIQPLDLGGAGAAGAAGDVAAFAPWLPDVTIAGKIYGLPTQPDALVLWYRVDLLESAGLLRNEVPLLRDWPSYQQAAQALNQPPERYGVALAGSDIDAGSDFAAVLAGFGGQVVGSQPAAGDLYQVEIDSPEAQRALEFYTALRSLAVPGLSGFTRADVLATLGSGRAAFGIAPLSAAGTLLECKVSPKICQAGRPLLAWSWLPGLDEQTATGSLGAWAIPLHAAHPEQARRFAIWLASASGAQAWAQGGGVPAHTGVLAALPSSSPAGPRAAAALAKIKIYRLAFPPLSNEAQLMKACSSAVSSAVTGEQTPAQALTDAAEQMRKALRQAGY